MDIKNLSSNLRWLFAGTIVSNIISVIISIFIIRRLPVEAFGIYSLFTGSMVFFSVISTSGLISALRRFIPELLQKKYYLYLRSILKIFFVSALLLSLACLFTVYIFKTEVGALLKIDMFDVYYSIFMINIFIYLQWSLISSILVSMYEQKIVSLLALYSIIARAILYLIYFHNINLERIFIIEAIAVCINTLPGIYVIIDRLKKYLSQETEYISSYEKADNKKRIRRFVLLSSSNEMGSSILSEVTNYYFIIYYLGPTVMGLFAFPYKLVNMVFNWVPITQANNILRNFFISKYYEEADQKSYLNNAFNFLIKIYILLYGLIIIFIISYQEVANIYLFKSKYIGTQTLLFVILLFYMLRAISYPVNVVMEAAEKIQYSLYSKIFAVVNILLVVGVLKYTKWGVIGVASATGLAVFLKDYFIYVFLKIKNGIRINVYGVVKILGIIVPALIVMYVSSLSNNLAVKILLPAVLGSIVLFVMYKIISPFNNKETLLIENVLSKMLVRIPFKKKEVFSIAKQIKV